MYDTDLVEGRADDVREGHEVFNIVYSVCNITTSNVISRLHFLNNRFHVGSNFSYLKFLISRCLFAMSPSS